MPASYPIQAVITAVDRATGPIRGVVAKLGGPLTGSLSNVRDAAARVSSQLSGMLGPLALIGAGGAALGLGALVHSFVDAGSAVNDTSAAIGISVEALQEFHYIAKLNGVAATEMDDAVTRLNRSVADAASGRNVNAMTLFRRLGISLRDSNGQLRTAEQLMPELAEAFKKNTNPIIRAAIGNELFGRSYAKMVPMLQGGRAEFQRMREEARALGVVIGADGITAADDFGDSMDRISMALEGARNAIAVGVLPILQPLLDNLTEWIKLNRELIATRVTEFVAGIADALLTFDWSAAATGLGDLLHGINVVVQAIGGWDVALSAIAVLMAAPMLSAVLSLTTALGGLLINVVRFGVALLIGPAIAAFSTAMEAGLGVVAAFNLALYANPIGLVIAGIAALGVAIYALYSNWNEIADFFVGLWEKLDLADTGRRLIASLWGGMRAVFDNVTSWFSDKLNSLTELLPGWLRNGLNVGTSSGTAPGAAPMGTTAQAANRSVLAGAATRQRLEGEMVVRFENAPLGTRVDTGRTNTQGVDFSPEVGYGSAFTGVP